MSEFKGLLAYDFVEKCCIFQQNSALESGSDMYQYPIFSIIRVLFRYTDNCTELCRN